MIKHRRRWNLQSRRPAFFRFPDKELVWVCIGTDRSTGDCLGPLVGTMLTKAGVPYVYGTLDHPVHALNLTETLEKIECLHEDACFIAIDACLGKVNNIGNMILRDGFLVPGSGVGKTLPHVGDYHIIGIVNVAGFKPHEVLQNTRLSQVTKMAESITDFILRSLEVRGLESVATTKDTAGGMVGNRRSKPELLESGR